MRLQGVIFDLDGTFVDTNEAHVEAWRRAFAAHGYDISADRIRPEIGKGGDHVVPDLIGKAGDEKDGDALRKANGENFQAIAKREKFRVFPGSEELIREVRRRGWLAALATSSKPDHLKGTFDSCGVDFTKLVDVAASAADAEASKPSPDLIHAALAKLRLDADSCAMVGDTPHDGTACTQAGVRFWGLTCGGTAEGPLRAAGAEAVFRDPADLLAHLDDLAAAVAAGEK